MILGFNCKRPIEKDYDNFINEFVRCLESIGNNQISLMLYGSYIRGDYNPGRSDIDAVLTFPHDVVIDKKLFQEISKALSSSLMGRNVPFQVTPTDLTVMKDGRLNSYNLNFKDYFEMESKVVFGLDYKSQFKYELPKFSDQEPLRYNLRKARQGLLFSEWFLHTNYESFLNGFNKTLDSVSRGSKILAYITDGQFRRERFGGVGSIEDLFGIDERPLKNIKEIYANLDKLDALYKNPSEVLKVWNESLTFFEEVIRAYIKKSPNN